MILMTIHEIKQLSLQEIEEKIHAVKKEIFELRFKQATRQPVKTHLFRVHRRFLAQLLTVEHNYQRKN